MLMTNVQCRMARACLGLTMRDLNEKVGINKDRLSYFERGDGKLSYKNLGKLRTFFEDQGLEFTDYDGVRRKPGSVVKTYRGQAGFIEFFDDIYEVVKNTENPDVCISNVEEAQFDYWLGDFEPVHVNRMTALSKPNLRVLLKEKDTHMTSTTYCEYRWTTKEQFADVSLYLYGHKSAFIQFTENDVIVTVVESEAVTDSLRKMFNSFWQMASTKPNIDE